MTELLPNIFAIEVPEEASRFETSLQPDNIPCVTYWYWENLDATVISLPPGSYEILFTTKGVSEEQAATIVERDRGGFAGNIEGYKEYFKPGDWAMDNEPFETALRSLESLLTSKNLDSEKNYLLIRKV